MIKNAIIYKAHLPVADALEEHLATIPSRYLHSVEASNFGFVDVEIGSGLYGKVVRLPGSCITFRLEIREKIVPPSVVKAEVEKKVKTIETGDGRKLSRAEKAEIKEEIYDGMLRVALVRSRVVSAYFIEDDQYLIVDTSSKKDADKVVHALVHATESVKTETINVSGVARGLTARLIRLTRDHDFTAFGEFAVGLDAKLVAPDGDGDRITYSDVDIASSEEVASQLSRGMKVDHLGLIYQGVEFKITSDFHFKRFEWPDFETESPDDAHHEFSMTAFEQLRRIRSIVNQLVDIMKYEEQKQEKEDVAV